MGIESKKISEDVIWVMRKLMPEYLRVKGVDTSHSFQCLSPDHRDRHPSMSYTDYYLGRPLYKAHCFSCGCSYDIFDLVGQDFGIKDWLDQARKVADLFNITLIIEKGEIVGGDVPQVSHEVPNAPEYKEYDITTRIKEAQQNVIFTEYFKDRGFTDRLIYEKMLGYWPSGYNDFVGIVSDSLQYNLFHIKHYNLIVPVLNQVGIPVNFIARIDNDELIDEYHRKTLNMRGVRMAFINEAYLSYPKLLNGIRTIFVVEGWADAYSIEDVGGRAIALNSTSNVQRFLKICDENRELLKDITFVAAGDRDMAGKKMNIDIQDGYPDYQQKGLNQLRIKNMPFNVAGIYKDANEFLVKDRDGFASIIQGVMERRFGRFRSSVYEK